MLSGYSGRFLSKRFELAYLSYDLAEHFARLDDFLIKHQIFWQGMTFEYDSLPWRDEYVELCQWLDKQSLSSLEQLKAQPDLLIEHVGQWLQDAKQYSSLCDVPVHLAQDEYRQERWMSGIPGRKCAQIVAFNQAIDHLADADAKHWLEWCAGKGYLGRLLSLSRQAQVTSLEWQACLCEKGQAFVKANAPLFKQTFVQADAFSLSAQALIKQCSHAVALHACGDLHVALLKGCVALKTPDVSVSPCCYHLIHDDIYQPLSSLAKRSSLRLDKNALKLPVQETVTAGNATKERRYQEMTYRLALDSLLSHQLQSRAYIAIPSIKKSSLKQGFESFCRKACQQKGFILNQDIDFDYFLRQGERRFLQVEKMETMRTLFRRPLELWLVLDRALYLSENGFDVKVSQFCSKELTPRNLLINARRKNQP